MKTVVLLSACTALLASTSSGALAQSVAQPGFYKGDVAAFHGTDNTLTKAIETLHLGTGAKVVDIRFARQDGLPGYHVVLQKNGRFTFMHIDERDGHVVAIESTNAPDWMLNWRNRARLRLDRMAKVSLSQAIRTAEAENNHAPAIAAGIAMSASNPGNAVYAYNVILDVNGQTQRVAVDARTGEVIANPDALSAWS